jgi:long-chain acyl-CoA synthetase
LVEVPVNLRFIAAELRDYLGRVKPDVIIATSDMARRAREIQGLVPSIRTTIGIGAGHGLDHDYEELLARTTPNEGPLRDPDETVLVCSTSGTSGRAKAVRHTQRTTAAAYTPLIARFDVDEDAHVVTGLPMYFATAYSGWTMSFVAGARQSMIPSFDARAYVDLVETVRGSHALLGPAPVYAIMDAGLDLSRLRPLRYLSMGGAACDATRLQALVEALGDRIAIQYAMTEVSIATSLLGREFIGADGSLLPRHRSIGRPFDGLEIRVVDEAGAELPFDGEARGELQLSGSFVTPGYVDDPAADADAFDGEWLRTGDVAVVDADETISIVDRKKDMIVSGGINIAPAEVEQTIARHPEVQAVGVCAVPDARYGEAVHAAVVRMPGSTLTDADVIAWCSDHLASIKKPRSVEFVDELPISSTGKLLRRELRERAAPT